MSFTHHSIFPIFHHSSSRTSHHSNTPLLQSSKIPSFHLLCCDARPLGPGDNLDLLIAQECKRFFDVLNLLLQKAGEDHRSIFFKEALEIRQEFHESVAREVGNEDRKNIVQLGD